MFTHRDIYTFITYSTNTFLEYEQCSLLYYVFFILVLVIQNWESLYYLQQVKHLPSCCWPLTGLSLVNDPVRYFHGQDLEVQLGRRLPTVGTSELPLCFLQMVCFCCLHQIVTFCMHWGCLQLSVKLPVWKTASLKSEVMVLCLKMVDCSLWVWKWRSSTISRACS